MKVLFMSVGTRGDAEPHLALAEMLANQGHEVACAFPEQLRALTESSGLAFYSLGSEFLDLLHGEAGKKLMGGSAWEKAGALFTVLKQSFPVQRALIRRQAEIVDQLAPDRIVHNGKAIFPFLWSLQHADKAIQISPVPFLIHANNHQPNIGLGQRSLGKTLNRLTYKFGNAGITQSIRLGAKWLGYSKRPSRKHLTELLLTQPFIFLVSPTLVKPNEHWPDNVKTLGFLDRNRTSNWQPNEQLKQFLSRHEKVLMLTFGSMTNQHPAEKTQTFLNILTKYRIPALINLSEGGLEKPAEYDKSLFHFVEQIPYDWAFPKMYAVIHHGGSGTTHMAARHACASLVIPHAMDQFVWNTIAHNKGLGPKGIGVNKITEKNLEPKILDLWQNPAYKARAEAIAKSMQNENFKDELLRALI